MPPRTKWSAKPATKFIVVKVPIRFHGVLTPNAKLPSKIAPAPAPLALTSSEQLDKDLRAAPDHSPPGRRKRWFKNPTHRQARQEQLKLANA
jgi:hypothetical protein